MVIHILQYITIALPLFIRMSHYYDGIGNTMFLLAYHGVLW